MSAAQTPVLVLVDVQYDYLRFSSSPDLIERVRALTTRCRNEGVPVVHVWTTVHRESDDRMPHWRRADRWICVEGTSGHDTPVQPLPGEFVVHKTFFSAFENDDFDAVLAALGVNTIWLAGVQMQSCIRATAIDAYRRGFRVHLQHDAIGSEDALHAAMSRRYLDARLGEGSADNSAISSITSVAQTAWHAWRNTSQTDRIGVLQQFADRLDVDAVAELIANTVRKPMAMARAEVARAIALVRLAARPESLELPAGPRSIIRYRPRGVVAVITPYNNPVAIPLGRIAPALMYGNVVVWKPSPMAGTIANYLTTLIEPHGLVQVVHGDGHVAEQLMADPRVDAVVVTGAESTGTVAQLICAQRHIPVQAELGGNNAAIVCADTDLAVAAREVADGAFGFAGQRCTANRRVIVERACLDAFLAQLAVVLPDPGLLISSRKRDQVAALVARTPGVLFQGLTREAPEHFPATVIRCDDAQAEIVQEETFGPVLVVQCADDFDEAMTLCNGVRQGLVAALFSSSVARQQRFLADAQAGILKLNMTTADADAEAPFGGWKASGVGPPEHGRSNREVYTRTQAVYS